MAKKINKKDSVLLTGTSSADSIRNYGSKVTINGGKGNDDIDNEGSNVTIDGGKGNDEIDNEGDRVTISGGKGDDLIKLDYYKARNTLIQYMAGDGNDIIRGFNSTSTLSIGGGYYSTTKSGKDLIVTVGKSKITLSGAARLNKLISTAQNF